MDLFRDLLSMEGDQLLISSGYITNPGLLPCSEIVQSVESVVFASGHWQDTHGKHTLDAVVANAEKFALKTQREARASNRKAPKIIFYTDAQWHAKVALKRRSKAKSISAAIIGSSNLSISALDKSTNWPNQEVDVLITEDDGPDAKEQLGYLFKTLGNSFKGKKVELGAWAPIAAQGFPANLSPAAKISFVANYKAAQVVLTLSSRFFALKKRAAGFESSPFAVATRQPWAGKNTFEMGLEYAEIILAGMAGSMMNGQGANARSRSFVPPSEDVVADLDQARRVLQRWNVGLLREDLLDSAAVKLNMHRCAWKEIVDLMSANMAHRQSISSGDVESLPSVRTLLGEAR